MLIKPVISTSDRLCLQVLCRRLVQTWNSQASLIYFSSSSTESIGDLLPHLWPWLLGILLLLGIPQNMRAWIGTFSTLSKGQHAVVLPQGQSRDWIVALSHSLASGAPLCQGEVSYPSYVPGTAFSSLHTIPAVLAGAWGGKGALAPPTHCPNLLISRAGGIVAAQESAFPSAATCDLSNKHKAFYTLLYNQSPKHSKSMRFFFKQ